MLSSGSRGFRPRSNNVAAAKIVRSAPTSTRNSTGFQEPSPANNSPRITGRTIPSSHNSHSPSIRINAYHLLWIDVTDDASLIFRVRNSCRRQSFFRRVADEQFLASHHDEFAAMLRLNLMSVRLQPVRVTLRLRPPSLEG